MIDTATNTVVGTPVGVGSFPVGVAVSPDGSRVYVANKGSANVSVIDTTSNTVLVTVSVGGGPFAFGLFILPLLMGVGLLLTACSSGISTSSLSFSHTSLANTGYGTLTLGVSGMPDGGLASIEVKSGGLSFNPSLFIVTGIKGLHGFTVLASVIDNSAGKVSFAAVNPSGGATGGGIVQFSLAQKGLGSSTVKIDTSKLVLGDANNQSISVGSVNVGSETISIP